MARRTETCFQEVIIENLDDACIAVDKNGNIKIFNSMATAMFGISPEEAINKKIWDVVKIKELNNLIMDSARNISKSKIEKIVIIGQTTPYLIKIFQALKEDKLYGSIAILRNLSEYAKIEKALSNYVGNLSHELKAPLTAIKGYVETLLEESYFSNPEISRKFLQIINDETNRMTRMIVDLLDATRNENIKENNLSLVSPYKAIIQSVKLFEGLAKQKNIEIEMDVPENISFIMAREDYLRQIFVNILDNAIKFTGIKKSGHIKILGIPDGKKVKFIITDTGIGIPENSIPFVFDKFYRVKDGEASSLGGTGLGLSITKKLVEDISGTIDISSKLGEWTKVTVSFPAGVH